MKYKILSHPQATGVTLPLDKNAIGDFFIFIFYYKVFGTINKYLRILNLFP